MTIIVLSYATEDVDANPASGSAPSPSDSPAASRIFDAEHPLRAAPNERYTVRSSGSVLAGYTIIYYSSPFPCEWVRFPSAPLGGGKDA